MFKYLAKPFLLIILLLILHWIYFLPRIAVLSEPEVDTKPMLAPLQRKLKRASYKNMKLHGFKPPWVEEVCAIRPGEGMEGDWGFQALAKVQIADNKKNPLPSGVKRKRVMCIVLTDSTRHKGALRAIRETYGPNCDGFLAASNTTDPSCGALDVWSELLSDATDWHKVRLVWKHVHTYCKDDYDFFHLSGDSTYVIAQNLRYQLSIAFWDEGSSANYEERHNQPLYIGGAVVASEQRPNELHCGGGAGYTLNSVALNLYMESWACNVDSTLPADLAMAACFRQQEVKCFTMRGVGLQGKEDGAWMYHEHGLFSLPPWNREKNEGLIRAANILGEYHGILPNRGLDAISKYSTSFNLVDGMNPMSGSTASVMRMRRMHAIVYRLCDAEWERPMGALDEDGNSGYVHDTEYVKKHPLPFTYHPKGDSSSVCEIPFGEGPEERMGYQGLKKIKIMDEIPDPKQKRVLCIVYTHSNRHDRVQAIAETYAPRCDGFMAASNLTDPSIGAVNLLHEGPELYSNMWAKIGGDDYYLVAENLRYVLSTGSWKGPWNQSSPLYLGGPLVRMPYIARRYCGGGSGYTLNSVALRLMIEELFKRQVSWPHWGSPQEDLMVAASFEDVNIHCMDTNDHLNETRYHPLDVNTHVKWTKGSPALWGPKPLENKHGIASKEKLGQISESSVSFHLKSKRAKRSIFADEGLRRYHAILYDLCDNSSARDAPLSA